MAFSLFRRDTTIIGTQRLYRRLQGFGKKLADQKLRRALRAGARPILQRVKQLAPVLARESRSAKRRTINRVRVSPRPVPGLLRRSFGIRAMKRKKNRVGILVITGRQHKAAYYGWFVERGTHQLSAGIVRKHRRNFSAQHGTQRIKPRLFIRRSFDQTQRMARQIIRADLQRGLKEATVEARSIR